METRNPLIVALDGDWSLDDLVSTAGSFAKSVGMAKIGKRLFTRFGPPCVHAMHALDLPVFLDLKFHDIPNTVAQACEEAVKLGVRMLNVHASGGYNMMTRAAESVQETAFRLDLPKPDLIAVTVLTSLDRTQIGEVGIAGSVSDQVKRLAELAQKCGLDGVVASPHETPIVREVCGPDFLIVTPGVRPNLLVANDDQRRVMTPKHAIEQGADYLVIGRPIVNASDPSAAVRSILAEIEAS